MIALAPAWVACVMHALTSVGVALPLQICTSTSTAANASVTATPVTANWGACCVSGT